MKRKLVFGIVIAAMVGGGLWMRELASWRPKTVAKVSYVATQLVFSRDGKQLWVEESHTEKGMVVETENGTSNAVVQKLTSFKGAHGLETFPRIWFDNSRKQFLFSPVQGQIVELFMGIGNESDLMSFEEGHVKTGWSQKRSEVYGEVAGNLYTWNWKDGKLKKRVRYEKSSGGNAVFSPNGKWVLAYQAFSAKQMLLKRYDVQSGKLMEVLDRGSALSRYGFSPDGKWLWFIRDDVLGKPVSFHAVPVSNSKILQGSIWSQGCSGPSKWMPDGRIGIVREKDFEWRSATGRLLQRLPGPIENGINANKLLVDWTLSPDENWIYSCERSGTIRRWRAL